MPSQFFGLNIGANALSAFQTAVNTTANNISNVQTDGYTRQTTNIDSTSPLRVNTKYGSVGTGVQVTSITQERNLYYDEKFWNNSNSLGLYEEKLYYLNQIETVFTDDSIQEGFTTIFNKMFTALDTLKNNSGDESVRNQFINSAQALCTYFNMVSENLRELQDDCNDEIKSQVDNINSISEKISLLNKEINRIEVAGGIANELRDQRASLIDELSAIINVETIEREVVNSDGANLGSTYYTVIINGQILVENNDYRTLKCVSSEVRNNQSDAKGMYEIVWEDTGMDFASTAGTSGGSLKALFEVRDGNNNDGLKGGVVDAVQATDTTPATITIAPPSISQVNALNLPAEGRILVNSTYYTYSGWEAKTDAEGKITEIKFTLNEKIEVGPGAIMGEKLEVGSNIDAYGIPYYQQQLNEFLRNFIEMFNNIEKNGTTLDGEQMTNFFISTNATGDEYDLDEFDPTTAGTIDSTMGSYYQMTASNIAVNAKSLKDSRYLATTEDTSTGNVDKHELVENLLKLQSDVTVFRGNKASAFLETLLTDISVDVEKTKTYYNNFHNLGEVIGNLRTSVSGVDQDEEALNLIKFQNAYNMSSKLISVLSEMYDKLINETGVT